MISFEHRRQPHVLSLIIAFFGGILTVLVLQNAGMGGYLRAPAATIIRMEQPVQPPGETEQPVPVPPRPQNSPASAGCSDDADCPHPLAICTANGQCATLNDPVCLCTQERVLQCADRQGRAKHTFCPGGCVTTEMGPQCL